MTSIYLIRHAEAEGNIYRRAQGQWNRPLTLRGRQQAETLSERFRDIPLSAVYSSDLMRAVDTAKALVSGREPAIPVSPLASLREINMGVWESESWGILRHNYPEQTENFIFDPENWSVPGSEGYKDNARRMNAAVTALAEENDGKSIAIVSHGISIRSFLTYFMKFEGEHPTLIQHGDNTAVSYAEYSDGVFTCKYYNDASHLPEELSPLAIKRNISTARMAIRPLDLSSKSGADYYTNSYKNAWFASHGSAEGYSPGVYLTGARSRSKADPDSVLEAVDEDERLGVLELQPRRGREEGLGWVSLLYVEPERRRQGIGVALLGCAESYFEKKGRRAIALHVAVTNSNALEFYQHFGYEILQTESGVASDLYVLQKKLI